LVSSYKPVFVVIPVFNDWESCLLLLESIRQKTETAFFSNLIFCWVNDGSSEAAPANLLRTEGQDFVVDLTRNVGHQKAIALGIAYVAKYFPGHAILVMDADGEDRPEHLEHLAGAGMQENKIVFARRTKRHEGILFQSFYRIYKLVFRLLTGKSIAFGNFSYIPESQSGRVAHVSEIWNHFSGGIIKSRIPYTSIPLERGKRLAGQSKMNFTSLVLHGLSAVAVHADTMAVRLMLFCAFLVAGSSLVIAAVAILKFFTPFASPGWATTVVTGFASIIMQSFLVSLLLLFVVLMYRTQKLFIPAKDYSDYISRIIKG
jgi:cellulose synthase/poly-beta-1,6-N-acetylglucosamine synthase-like glycosyltransferase